jgi:threonine dehydrogenase-like Zn-dependent dehydrogenase
VVEPVVVCGKCFFCRTGEYNRCTNINVQYRTGQGAFAPYFVADQDWTHRLPEGISFEEGALVEPLSVALHAVKAAKIRAGQSVALFGAGALGLMVLLLAKKSGAAEIFVVDVNHFRLEKAKKLGASHTIDAAEHEAAEVILEQTNQLGVDRAFEAVGIEKTLVDSMKVLKKGRTSIILGLFEEPDIQIPANMLVTREIALKGCLTYCWDFQDTLKLLEMGDLKLDEIITHTMSISKLQQAFELLMDPANEAVKVVIQID